ncbi:hypothetical protein PMZ80_003651 [Knufia obscura]|uniref:ER membrane protein complex subunit 6 n=2 Tax=Knufia TaxID=430999 RepID=A0AAN8FGZ1_9EURO|nr:hypothetical protein PMZ80_003651 [Knufia obscura]KAK5958436.1 hypothetical protein OHC33_000279 [Knufia fluminis]
MPPTLQETHYALYPLVPDSLQHNTRMLSNLRSISSLFLGIAAGILGLESLNGFLFYFISQQLISSLFYFLLVEGEPERYFAGNVVKTTGAKGGEGKRVGAWRDVWLGGGLFTEGLSGFVLGWAGVGGVIR